MTLVIEQDIDKKDTYEGYGKYNSRGLTGLQNLGNTCYLNSILQSLSHTYELQDFLEDKKWAKKVKNNYDSLLLVEFDKLMRLMWSQNCIVSPKGFVSFVQKLAKHKKNSEFCGWDQSDASEFLVFILDGFHNSLKRSVTISINGNVKNDTDKIALKCCNRFKELIENDYSEIVDIFYGMQATIIYDKDNNISSKKTIKNVLSIASEPFFILSVPIPPNKSTLYDCLDVHTECEELVGDNKWYNDEKGEKQDAIKKMLYWSLPKVLIIDMKRYNYSGNKNQKLIDFPINELDMRKYVIGYDKEKYIYDCYAICNHSGSVYGGHYTAYVKNANGKWYHYNDSNVKEVRKSSLITSKAYCLFYRIKNN